MSLARDFVDHARKVSKENELHTLMESVCSELGFRYFALIHHADLRTPPAGVININNYPAVWADYFVERQLFKTDPVVHASFRSTTAFQWSDLSSIIRLTPIQRRILDCAAREGLAQGITVPHSLPGECPGSCSFGTPKNEADIERNELVAQIIGTFAFEAAMRLANPAAPTDRRFLLSPRQRECLVLIGQGKSDWTIGQILGLSAITIGHYVTEARRRYGVATRQQLIVRALFNGEIGFTEICTRNRLN
ncbi:MAG: LuxR family transcriptional regulator [Pseudomonadota bacterium]